MLRVVLAVIVGYVVVIIAVLLGIAAAWSIVGAEGAFQPDSTAPSTSWVLMNLVFGFLAAAAGGFVAALIGRQSGVKALVFVILVLGLGFAVYQLSVEPPSLPEGKTDAELTFEEAGQVATPPAWYNFGIPFIGALGALAGGSLSRR